MKKKNPKNRLKKTFLGSGVFRNCLRSTPRSGEKPSQADAGGCRTSAPSPMRFSLATLVFLNFLSFPRRVQVFNPSKYSVLDPPASFPCFKLGRIRIYRGTKAQTHRAARSLAARRTSRPRNRLLRPVPPQYRPVCRGPAGNWEPLSPPQAKRQLAVLFRSGRFRNAPPPLSF